MKREAFLRNAARNDLVEAAAWYEEQRKGLGNAFIDEFLAFLDDLESHADMYPLVEGSVRRALLRVFPYSIYYTIEQEHIEILRLFHAHREPGSWRSDD